MTKDQYSQIKLEMFVSKVHSIIACAADPVTETKFGDIRTAMYRYRSAEGGSDIVLMFQNRQLVAKQAGGSF